MPANILSKEGRCNFLRTITVDYTFQTMLDLRFIIVLLLVIAWLALFVFRRKFIRKDSARIIATLERIEGKLDAIVENQRRS
jgi:hypothetical protein